MNKEDFLAELRQKLKVKKEDKEGIMEEYKSYFNEAMANGQTEEEIINALETPDQIAKTCNEDLGVEHHDVEDMFEEGVKKVTKEYKKFMDSDVLDKITKKIDKAMDKLEGTIEEKTEKVDIEGTFDRVFNKVGETVSKVIDKVKDIDFEAHVNSAVGGVAMKFDNSKVETFEYDHDQLNIVITDENQRKLQVEIVGSEDKLISKVLPTSLALQLELEGDTFRVTVPSSGILYSEKKRMRIYVPRTVSTLNVNAGTSLSVVGLDCDVNVEMQNAPLSMKGLEGDSLQVKIENGPVSLKDLSYDQAVVHTGNGPVSVKDVDGQSLTVLSQNGPLSIKDLEVDVFEVQSQNGPVNIKNIDGTSVGLHFHSGPTNIKDITAQEVTVTVEGGLLNMKNITCDVLKGDISGAMNSLKDIQADRTELNK